MHANRTSELQGPRLRACGLGPPSGPRKSLVMYYYIYTIYYTTTIVYDVYYTRMYSMAIACCREMFAPSERVPRVGVG